MLGWIAAGSYVFYKMHQTQVAQAYLQAIELEERMRHNQEVERLAREEAKKAPELMLGSGNNYTPYLSIPLNECEDEVEVEESQEKMEVEVEECNTMMTKLEKQKKKLNKAELEAKAAYDKHQKSDSDRDLQDYHIKRQALEESVRKFMRLLKS